MTDKSLRPARLSPADVARVAAGGLRARPLRAFLSALGIAIGIAAMVAVTGVSASSRAELDAALDRLGTNLLTVGPGHNVFGQKAELPAAAVSMVRRIGPVQRASAVGVVDVAVYRNDHMPSELTNSIAVLATRPDLLGTVGATVRRGAWLDGSTGRLPIAVLGDAAAARLGIGAPGVRIWVGSRWFAVVGILAPTALAPELDQSVLVGWPAAQGMLGFDGHPTTIYSRSDPGQVEAVRGVLAATADPSAPDEVLVSRPSDALTAQRAADEALSGLLLGIGMVALLVGGIGVANNMVIAVLERRAEIGLRRSLGATRGQIRTQFLGESSLLSCLGGAGGALLGALVTAVYAHLRGWPVVVPAWALIGGVLCTAVVGTVAGIYPAVQASRLPPTEALSGG